MHSSTSSPGLLLLVLDRSLSAFLLDLNLCSYIILYLSIFCLTGAAEENISFELIAAVIILLIPCSDSTPMWSRPWWTGSLIVGGECFVGAETDVIVGDAGVYDGAGVSGVS